jgi:predicted anti-sigma-YlaC factor YlaD
MPIIEISCVHVWREISDYLDGETDPVLRERMSEHFRNCAHCSAVLDGARNILTLVADGKSFDLPEGFSSRLRKRLAQKLPKL